MEDEEEPPALDYARHYGLCTPYDSEKPFIGNLPTPSTDDLDQEPWGSSHAAITDTVNTLMKERLAVSNHVVLLLKEVYKLQEVPEEALLTRDWSRRSLDLKFELPILQTDNELDMLNFGSTDLPDFNNIKIPFEVVHDEKDEGFAWPERYLAYPAQCDAQIKGEKLTVSKDVLVYLQDVIRDSYVPEDSVKAYEESVEYKPNTAHRPLTPPLLPLSPSPEPYIPSSPANRLPLASDSGDSLAAETKDLEHQIMDADSFLRKTSDSDDSMLLDVTNPPPFSPFLEERTPLRSRRRPEDLKVEGPLTPPMFSDSPMKKLKSVSFNETLHQFIPEASWAANRGELDDDTSDPDFDELFKEIEPLARQAIKGIENERLSGADTTARVDIPEVDFTLPVAPWKEFSLEKSGRHRIGMTELSAQGKFILNMKREHLKTATSWHGLSSLNLTLPWGIFTTRISKISVDEKLHGETELNNILTEFSVDDIATSSAQVWKPDGLRIFDEEDSEEEIELADVDESMDVEALVRKRKLEIDENAPEVDGKRMMGQVISQNIQESKSCLREDKVPQRPQSSAARHQILQTTKAASNELMFGGSSITMALHKFMETRGKLVEPVNIKPTSGCRTSKDTDILEAVNLLGHSRDQSAGHKAIVQPQPQIHVTANDKHEASLPLHELPVIPQHLPPCSFIVSSTLLQQRSLMKQIEQHYQQAEVIYRDYDLPHSPAIEADILLSPSTGLFFTTLQQIKQQSLPGQPERSPVKERMSALQLRYERLVVLVSEGLSHEFESKGSSRLDDPRDKEALGRLNGFADQLEGEVLVKFIQGGEQALACSVVVEMAAYGLPHDSQEIGDLKPFTVETTWELFLRRAGLNPFAAQVVAAFPKHLKQPPEHPQTTSLTGLPAFLMMSEDERVKWFQVVMGGGRILKRVSRLLDQQWVSAAHGFRMG